jgi:hypothetical protein
VTPFVGNTHRFLVVEFQKNELKLRYCHEGTLFWNGSRDTAVKVNLGVGTRLLNLD